MERFSTELRADLQEAYGVDLPKLFRKRRWKHLLALIDGLPTHSRYMAALLSDPEIAEQLANSPDFEQDDKPRTPSLVGYSQINYQLAELNDSLKALQTTLIGVNGGRAKPPKPTPRPVTALEQAKKDKAKKSAENLASLFAGQSTE